MKIEAIPGPVKLIIDLEIGEAKVLEHVIRELNKNKTVWMDGIVGIGLLWDFAVMIGAKK